MLVYQFRLSMLGADIYANADGPFEFENDFFKGRMLFLVKCNPPDPRWAAHFEGSNSNRAFEMQIQGKLKLLPKGEVIRFALNAAMLFFIVLPVFRLCWCCVLVRAVSNKKAKTGRF